MIRPQFTPRDWRRLQPTAVASRRRLSASAPTTDSPPEPQRVFLAHRKRSAGHESSQGSKDRAIFAHRRQNAGIQYEEVQKVLHSIDTSHVIGHRDKALLATLAYTFARIGAVVNLKVEDYFQTGKRSLIRFKEKGGKEKEIPVHHKLLRSATHERTSGIELA
jgi:integrase